MIKDEIVLSLGEDGVINQITINGALINNPVVVDFFTTNGITSAVVVINDVDVQRLTTPKTSFWDEFRKAIDGKTADWDKPENAKEWGLEI